MFDWKLSLTPFNVGIVAGALFFASLFAVETQSLRIILGIFMGLSFSPVFYSERTDSTRYYALSFILLVLVFAILKEFKFGVIATLLIITMSTGIEAQAKGATEVAERQRK
jgi:hypothetical protein